MSSEFFKVESIRDGINHCAYFEEGILKDYKEIKTSEKTGTRITFKPDKKVFIYMEKGFVYDRICEEIKNISYLNKGVKFILNNGKKTLNCLNCYDNEYGYCIETVPIDEKTNEIPTIETLISVIDLTGILILQIGKEYIVFV